MKKFSCGFILLWMVFCSTPSAEAQISIGIGLPNVNIGINLPFYPDLVRVPGYPVYYAPQMDANFFFYDGMYWVYRDDTWYASSWYNGPWSPVNPEVVPLYVLRIPVRYYRQPPVYFRGWQTNAPPRWGQHWGRDWEHRRSGWNKWNRGSAPKPAPLPVYQRHYSGDRYPHPEQQHDLHNQKYRYQPQDKAVRQHFKQQVEQKRTAPAQQRRHDESAMRNQQPSQEHHRPQPVQHPAPAVHNSPPQHQSPPPQRGPAVREERQQHEQRQPRSLGQEQRGEPRDHNKGNGQEQRNDGEHGRGRDK